MYKIERESGLDLLIMSAVHVTVSVNRGRLVLGVCSNASGLE